MKKSGEAPVELLAILHAAHAAENELESRLNQIGLSLAKVVALKALAEAGESMPLGQLAERLACVKSNITQLVDRLEADGLVARQSDPRDRRTTLAALTAAGKKAVKDGTRVQQDAERDLLKRLSPAEAQQLSTLLNKMNG
jgi:DNA-binding MarR family transcriptional regulator